MLKSSNDKNIYFISTLRGFAALLVFISHLHIVAPTDVMFIIGRIGVTLFFLISGYLSFESIKKRSLKQYFFNRFIRMYPVYWVILIISWFVYDFGQLSIIKLIANATLFQEFLGFDNIIGASWMMPIQIIFYIIVGFLGVKIVSTKNLLLTQVIFAAFSVILGVLRFYSNKPFPTAFALLIMIGFIGVSLYFYQKGKLCKRDLIWMVLVFELALLIGSILSYENWYAYLIAYNFGIVSFLGASKKNLSIWVFNRLGEIGFAFFLGPGLIYAFLSKAGLCGTTEYMTIIDCCILLISALLFSIAVTFLIEKPLFRKAKKIECFFK